MIVQSDIQDKKEAILKSMEKNTSNNFSKAG
jgi:hypothetical protein